MTYRVWTWLKSERSSGVVTHLFCSVLIAMNCSGSLRYDDNDGIKMSVLF